jgi:hypothetical protein
VTREQRVADAFVGLANSLVDDFDVVDLLTGLAANCAELLDIASAGVLLADDRGLLHVVAASSESTWRLELFQLQRDQGPCLDCYHSGEPVVVPDLAREAARWPRFVEAALGAGFASVHAMPMRLPRTVLGALGLFGSDTGALSDADRALAQALAHVGSVAILRGQGDIDRAAVADRLRHAVTSRVVLEQAKGFLADQGQLDVDAAFTLLRTYAHAHHLLLADVARAVVDRSLPVEQVLASAGTRAVESTSPDR